MVGILIAIAATLHYVQTYLGGIGIALPDDSVLDSEVRRPIAALPRPTVEAAQATGVPQVAADHASTD
jgi:hypothetical protein